MMISRRRGSSRSCRGARCCRRGDSGGYYGATTAAAAAIGTGAAALLAIPMPLPRVAAIVIMLLVAVGVNGNSAAEQLTCASGLRRYDHNIHKSVYRVGVHAIRGFEAAVQEYNKTFGEYLTETAGKRFTKPITFEMVPMTYTGLFDAVYAQEVDLFYANPGIFSCVGTEVGAEPLATIISRLEVRGNTFDLDVFGGVIFTHKDSDEINNIEDLKDKIIAAGGIAQVHAGQTQFYEMIKAGMSYVMDPKQVIFTGNQFDVVNGVLSKEFDVGFVRTDTIERTNDADGNPVDTSLFKVIQPKIYVLDDGNLFPFLHSTDIYPEWPVFALDHVPKDVAREVQEALLAVGDHATVGGALHRCMVNPKNQTNCDGGGASGNGETLNFPYSFDPDARCDTSMKLAVLAHEASRIGRYSGFRTTMSYMEPRTMQEAAGFLLKDERGNWKCTRAESLYEGIHCPADHYKLSLRQFENSCKRAGLPCKEGYDCYCKPCVKAFEVDVFQYVHNETDNDADDESGDDDDDAVTTQGCAKMSLCGSVEQTKQITFRAYDHLERQNAHVTALLHVGFTSKDLVVNRVPGTWIYEFSITENRVGVEILEIFVDGEQIPESPIRFQVVAKTCDGSTVPNEVGECVCGRQTLDMMGRCVSSIVFFVMVAVAVVVLSFVVGYFYLSYKRHQGDQMWHVAVEELHFSEPVEIIGQGSFGVVLLAEYRGTKVAVKRVLPPSRKHGNRGMHKEASASNIKSISSVSSGSVNGEEDDVDVEASRTTAADESAGGHDPDGTTFSNTSGIMESDYSLATGGLEFLDQVGTDELMRSRSGIWAAVLGCFPWAEEDEQTKMRKDILGAAASSSRSGRVAWCPWFDKNNRRKEEFIVEMRLLSRLRHPCITTVMGAVISPVHEPMLVMEYMEYGSLHDLLRNETMYAGGEIILQISRDIAQGLRYLHSSKPPILHGDLKARNILVDARFRAKVADFGLSSKKHSCKQRGIAGTPFWMAPEYLRGKTEYNAACDMYAVGIMFYEIYARKTPYEGENPKKVLRHVCNARINKRPPVPESCPPKMADMMKKCWSPDPFFRPEAKDLDMLLMDMNMQDAEPLSAGEKDHFKPIRPERNTADMLYEVFPKKIADALNAGQKVEPETHELVTVVFSDIVHFTDISRKMSPVKVCDMLDRLYLSFDTIARKHKVFKVETIGDAYMGVTNLDGTMEDTHVAQIAEFAIDIIEAAGKIVIDEEEPDKGNVQIRVGFHSGPVVSNVIGSLNPRYGLFGDTVNTASRMESSSSKGRILCTEKSATLLIEQAPHMSIRKRGKIGVKGKGEMLTYWVADDELRSVGHDITVIDNRGAEAFGSAPQTPVVQETAPPSTPLASSEGRTNPVLDPRVLNRLVGNGTTAAQPKVYGRGGGATISEPKIEFADTV